MILAPAPRVTFVPSTVGPYSSLCLTPEPPLCPLPLVGRASAFQSRSAQFASTPRRNGVTTRSRRIFMLALRRAICRRDCWSSKVNSRRSCLTLVVGVVKAPTMPPTFALAASVRSLKSGFISRDYEYHLYRCVCVSSLPMSEPMLSSLELTCFSEIVQILNRVNPKEIGNFFHKQL